MRNRCQFVFAQMGLVAGLVVSSASWAQGIPAGGEQSEAVEENELTIRAGGGSSDNIRRSLDNPESGSYTAVGLVSGIAQESRRIIAQLSSDLEYRKYSESDLDNELYGSLDASLEIQAVPDRVSWYFGDSYGQGRSDPFEIDRPENRDQVNVFSTGPRFSLPLGERTGLELSATKSARSLKDSDQLDSDATSTELGVLRSINSNTEFGIGVSVHDVEFDISDLDYKINTTSVSYSRELATGNASVAIGSSEVDYGEEDDSELLLDIGWSRDLGTRSNLALSYGQSFVDAVQDFRFSNVNDLQLGADVYKRKAITGRYEIQWSRTTASIEGRVQEATYTNTTARNYDEDAVTINVSRQLRRQWNVVLGYTTSTRDYPLASVEDERDGWRLGMTRTFSQRVSLEMAYDSVSQTGLQNEPIDEDVFSLFFEVALIRPGD